ncbi:hypothetical protein OZ668_03395 [Elizabethkingia sp. HX XZB]|uniref:hypothetical protein n=1 Tax=Elizabethkingia sp. HX XZB TaxID=3003193 RepID=UPI002A2435FD|nr:hypothetical protein [Elizabethkingia sp. HX XZB]MDX8567012.1 hypothetical protein [Elizabethkingia sp. HX XZB]
MKICVISFDYWHYDQYIVETLSNKGVDAHHINIGALTHASFKDKAVNAFSKVFLKKNLKYEKRQDFIIQSLQALGKQDQILVLNPDSMDISTLEIVKKYTDRLITYLYDSVGRFPVEDKLHYFDKIFSFDDSDVEKHGFEKLTNYIYLSHLPKEDQSPSNDLFYITSYDKKRLGQIGVLEKRLAELKVKSQFIIVGKKAWKKILQTTFFPVKSSSVTFRTQRTDPRNMIESYQNCTAILELMREGQNGLSFRVFEAIALEKKIITDNENIKNYDFYNPDNILVLDKDMANINSDFFQKPYNALAKEYYNKYTLNQWTERVFQLPLT